MSIPDVSNLEPLNKIRIPGNPNPSTRWRWITNGVSGVDCQRIKLQCWYVANRPFTTPQAVIDFMARCTETQGIRSARRVNRPTDISAAELAEVGL